MRVPSLILSLLIVAAAGCTTTSSLLSASNSLEDRTQRFYEQLRRDRSDDRVVRDAEALADAADDFERAVERRESRDELNRAFDRVAEHYHQLRDYYEQRDRTDRPGFAAVTDAYLEVEGTLKYRSARRS